MSDPTPDLDEIFDLLLRLAHTHLDEQGGFLPFGVSMAPDGAISIEFVHPDGISPDLEDDAALPADVDASAMIDTTTRLLQQRADAGELRAAGLCFDARFRFEGEPEPVDCIVIDLDHQTEPAVRIVAPYDLRREGEARYRAMEASPGSWRLFGEPPA